MTSEKLRPGMDFSAEELARAQVKIKGYNNTASNSTVHNPQVASAVSGSPADFANSLGLQAGFSVSEEERGTLRQLTAEEEQTQNSSLEIVDEYESEEKVTVNTGLGFVFWGLLVVVLLGGLEAWSLISSLWSSNPFVGILGSVVYALLLVVLIGAIWRDLRAIMYFKRTDRNREEYKRIIASGTGGEAFKLCEAMARVSGVYGSSEWERFASQIQSHYDASSVFSLYERMILRAQDEAARRIIVRASADTAVVVALSPLAWFDMLAALFRTVRMIRRISELYGMRLGFAGRIRLYRRVMHNLIFIGASELLTDAAADWLGAGFAGRLSAQLGQGVAAAIYSCRLGYLTVRELRPIEPSRDVMSLSRLRRDILLTKGMKQLLSPLGNKDGKSK